ncbi:hypothetical protein [Stakelama marina]|uniref:Uncharacterized protein n=1 Tax=Stakelama marina TaxID=2826939 RepID=A0A8T4IF77_9SPHN|nr:hypothetical protein [Stakelama marina]MBR0550909.1 hypothetical protein [Stakelama marina]
MAGLQWCGSGAEAKNRTCRRSKATQFRIAPADAGRIRCYATEILDRASACFLTVSLDPKRPDNPVIALLDAQWNPLADSSANTCHATRLLRAALAPLLQSLSEAWPPHALSQPLGVVSDGSGIGFSPDLPCPHHENWAGHIFDGDARLIELLAFQPGSTWSLLSTLSGGDTRH